MSLAQYSKPLSLLAKVMLLVVIFWFLLRGVDRAELENMLLAQEHSLLVEAGILLLVQVFAGAVRWQFVLRALGAHLSNFRILILYYISVFFNCCLPGTVGGDVVRVWQLKAEHIALPLAISSVVIDRMIALLALGVMGFVTMPILAGYIGVSAWVIMPICGAFGGLILWCLFHLEKLPILQKIHLLEHLAQSFRLMFSRPKQAFIGLIMAIMGHSCFCLCAYILATSLDTPITAAETFTLIPWVLLISIIPLSIGGWGLREGAMVAMLALAGIPKIAAITISVQIGLLLIIISLPAGVLWLFNRGKK